MAQGRDSAGKAMAFGLTLLFLMLLQSELAESAIYTVGNQNGWTFNSAAWTKGKRFRAGDVLIFKYSPSVHNVVAVNAAGYNACTTPKGSKIYKSGNDRITLVKGPNYFICNFPAHCESGMKMLVNAA
ncbi:basic blue protein [Dendrobium catenatum]|uniref:Plantacyanin n=1 Tax=Dendrobium catenatum TaxID=906689 RepID=A0A2I0WAR0_9ASPA|nr:basic blue protein [Dendrobium catenatum]PKU72740.1 Basic blue protein [Dendrobium catenatum]